MPKKKPTKVYRYDGQGIWTSSDSGYASYSDYELGSFLGGGAAGVVYEAECFKTKRHLAVKVLNPIGYKLAPSGSLRFCEVVVKGQPYGDVGGGLGGRGSRGGGGGHGGPGGGGGGGGGYGGGGGSGGAGKMSEKHVWWLLNASTRQTIAAYYDARTGVLKEMTLPKCIEVWGLGDDKGRRAGGRGSGRDRGKRDRDRDRMKQEDRVSRVFVGGEWVTIPSAPAKYDKFLRARASILREISNMLQLTEHPNILRLHEALELVQDSKATIFLVLELARGGELFDRIKVDCGADEGAARHYFRQLLSGVRHCHDRGVCHRDLKPENLLLADPHDSSVLKIADFGFSALFRELESESSSGEDSSGPTAGGGGGSVVGGPALRRPPSGLSLSGRTRAAGGAGARGGAGASGAGGGGSKGRGVRRLKSVVGSPYYVAPEVLREESGHGYDGTKADVWSMGVILYAMLAGNLPFEKELLTCSRFAKFGAWARMPSATASLLAHCSGNPKDAMDMDRLDYPSWFFPQHFSYAARSLLSGLLHPDASCRLSVRQALRHPWVLDGKLYSGSGGSSSDGSEFSVGAGGGVDDDPRPPDPQDIPSELLGADSDTEEEEREEYERGQDGFREWKEAGDTGGRRPGYRPVAQQAPPPPVVAAPTGTVRKSDRGIVADKTGGGVPAAAAAVKEANAAVLPKTTPSPPPPPAPAPATAAVEHGGIRAEGAGESNTEADGTSWGREQGAPGESASTATGDRGEPQASQPRPAPPAPPPPPSAAGSLPSKSSTSPTETKEGAGRGQQQRLVEKSEHVGVLETRVPPAGEGVVAGGKGGSGGGLELVGGGVLRDAEVVAAEAAAEEAVAAKKAAADMAAIKAAAVAAAVTITAEATAAAKTVQSPPSSSAAPLPAPPPLAPVVDAAQTFVTPRKLRSPRPLDVFSSPPLAPVGSGRAVEQDNSEFSLDAGPALPPERGRAKSREGLPPSVPRSKGEDSSASTAFPLGGAVERQLSMGVAGMAMAEAEMREGVVAAPPPAFHDLVKRSTRFMTSVPAAVVLRKIATIINADAHPLPYPYRNIKQKAVVHQDDYKLEIMRGGVLVCTVQIYLLGGEQRAAQYMVEFLRGQLDIFLFKRFYEDVRCKLNDLVKKDYSLALLESGTCTHRFRRFSNLA